MHGGHADSSPLTDPSTVLSNRTTDHHCAEGGEEPHAGTVVAMRIGIDLGTTRTIVAAADRGNYPVLTFPDAAGDAQEHIPTVIALDGGELVHGFAAVEAARRGAPHVRSIKRILGDPDAHPATTVPLGGQQFPLLDLLTAFLAHVREQLPEQAREAAVSVPAHAHTTQRMLTLEAFRRAGFTALAMLNEPSAAGFEYTHRHGGTLNSRRTQVAVYDLGGGTFDASLVESDGSTHTVLGSAGVNRLGGEDIDQALADLVLERTGTRAEELSAAEQARLLEACREAKESLTAQARRLFIDPGIEACGEDGVILPVDAVREAVAPLVERSLQAMEQLVGQLGPDSAVAGIYLVGGSSALPLVPRMLRERFGRRVHRSPYPSASTAIGLAIAADPEAGMHLQDRLSRSLGVFREAEAGRRMVLDPLLGEDTPLPPSGEVAVVRRYRAAHNLGWFRFVEHTGQGQDPQGDLIPHAEVLFPFDPALQGADEAQLRTTAVERRAEGPQIEETYRVDASGVISVRLRDLDTGFTRDCALTVPA